MSVRLRMLVTTPIAAGAVTIGVALAAPASASGEPADGGKAPAAKAGKGCYFHLFDGDDFDKTDDNFKLTKPGDYKSLKDLPGADEDWNDEADSAKVGPNATVKIWKDKNYKGESKTLKPGSKHPDLDPEPSSLKMSCTGGGSDTSVADSTTVSPSKGRVDLFARNTDNNHVMHQKYTHGSWSKKWTDLGGNIKGAPAVASRSQGRLSLFVAGHKGHVYHKAYRNDSWTKKWSKVGTVSTHTGPAAVSRTKGRVDVFATDTNHRVRHTAYRNGSWAPKWTNLKGNAKGAPAVASRSKGRLSLFATGPKDTTIHKAYRHNSWTTWNGID